MSDVKLKFYETTQFRVKELTINFENGRKKEKIDISNIFEEINLYDNLFMPCTSAKILIRDSQNLFERIGLNGDEKVIIRMDKGESNTTLFDYKKEFVIYKITDRTTYNNNSQIYTLNLVNEDFMYSLQKRVNQHYKGLYSEIVTKVLKDYLKVSSGKGDTTNSGIGSIYPTKNLQDIVIPFLTPFDTIDFITRRAVSQKGSPDFVFYENPVLGYNFEPVSEIMQRDPSFNINFNPKNVNSSDKFTEFLGARDMKILSSFDTMDTIKNGAYVGKFVGFDTVTRTQNIIKMKDAFTQSGKHANKESNLIDVKFKNDKSAFDMTDSRTVTYPYALTRSQLKYIKENNSNMANVIDNTHEYMFQRKAIFSNLMQKRIQIALPGNFGLYSGAMVQVNVPRFGIKDQNATERDSLDETMTGKYLIIGTRHIIKTNKHETLIEVATDSNIK
jgi:hypothetical protein